MAPIAVETPQQQAPVRGPIDYKEAFITGPKAFKRDIEEHGSETQAPASYPHYLPTWDPKVYPPLQPFEHYEHGKDADPTFPHLFANGTHKPLAPKIGSEVNGVQLSKLSDKGKDELALFIAQRKVAVFRDQDLADIPIQEALDFGGYFGRHHIHVSSGQPAGYPEIHLVHRGAEDTFARDYFTTRTNSITWHSDVTFEAQPPGTTFLYVLDGPEAGGDTIYASMTEAYNRLSPEFQKRLHGLKAIHSGFEQAENSRSRGGVVRREPIATEHPLVRTHPVTGEKALFVNGQFTRRIVGLKKEESDYLLKFLFNHIAIGADFQVRLKWEKGSVVVWDNRTAVHTAILDWDDGARRHLARITPQAERPYETPFEERK